MSADRRADIDEVHILMMMMMMMMMMLIKPNKSNIYSMLVAFHKPSSRT